MHSDDLTWLARNVGPEQWPNDVPPKTYIYKTGLHGGKPAFSSSPSLGYTSYTRSQWAERRAELQNKPSWGDAPEWATHLAQDSDGLWSWHADAPKCRRRIWVVAPGDPRGLTSCDAARGEVLGDWRDTLEERPGVMPSPYETAVRIIDTNAPDAGAIVDAFKVRGMLKCNEMGALAMLWGVDTLNTRQLIRHLTLRGVLDIDLRNVPCDCGAVDPGRCKCDTGQSGESEPNRVGHVVHGFNETPSNLSALVESMRTPGRVEYIDRRVYERQRGAAYRYAALAAAISFHMGTASWSYADVAGRIKHTRGERNEQFKMDGHVILEVQW